MMVHKLELHNFIFIQPSESIIIIMETRYLLLELVVPQDAMRERLPTGVEFGNGRHTQEQNS